MAEKESLKPNWEARQIDPPQSTAERVAEVLTGTRSVTFEHAGFEMSGNGASMELALTDSRGRTWRGAMPLSKRAIARRAAAVLAGRAVPMTREQIHERAESRRRAICLAIHAWEGRRSRGAIGVSRRFVLQSLGNTYAIAPGTVLTIHRRHCYRRAAIDVGCTCEPDKRDVACAHHGEQ